MSNPIGDAGNASGGAQTEPAGLISRLEAAVDGSRTLDQAILEALPRFRWRWGTPFTSYFEAALCLVPDRCDWDVGYLKENSRIVANIMWRADAREQAEWVGKTEIKPEQLHLMVSGQGATPSLAMCIAALKSRGWGGSETALPPASPKEPTP